MPIRPENRDRYPDNWSEIRRDILIRAGDRCEECGVNNHAIGYREEDGTFEVCDGSAADMAADFGEKVIKIVLTIAHLNHTPEDCRPENLKALCQRCHNRLDAPVRAHNRRLREARESGQTDFLSRQGRGVS